MKAEVERVLEMRVGFVTMNSLALFDRREAAPEAEELLGQV